MKLLCSVFALFLVGSFLSTALSAAPLDASVERAKYIVHLKVIGLEKAKNVAKKYDDGTVLYEDDWAVCEVKQIVLGMVATDSKGRLRVTSASAKSTVKLDNPIRFKTGDEFTIIADNCELNQKVGMVLPGSAQRIDGAPSSELMTLLDNRVVRAEATRDALAKLLPKAQAEVEKALKEFDEAKRDDFKDLSANADLLFDFCATAQYTPDLRDFPRPALSDADRKRLTKLALRAICDINEESAEIAAALVAAKGNGAHALTTPAALDESKALEALRRLATRKHLEPVLNYLLQRDDENRVAGWATKLAAGNDATSKICEWALIEGVEVGFTDRETVVNAFAPKGSGSAYHRALTQAFSKNALRLGAWLMLSKPATSDDKAVQGAKAITDELKTKLDNMYSRVEMLQVYAYVLGMRGADDADVAGVRGGMAGKVSARGKLDLADFHDVARELDYKEKLPHAVKRVLKRKGPENR